MRKAITISVLFHVGLLTWALGYLASSTTIKPVTKTSVPVDIMTPSQFTKIKAGEKTAKKKKPAPIAKKKKAAPKKPVKVVKKPAPKPKPKKVVKAKPKPKPVKKAAKPKPKPKKVVKAKPKPKPRKKQPPKPQSQFDAENIAALLNKLPDKQTAPKSSYKVQLQPAPKKQRQAKAEPTYGRSYGTDATMSANEIDAFKAQISQCWRPPTGGLGSRDLNVKLRIRFKPDGTLEKPPELANYSGSPFFRPAAEAAKRAVWQCQPYRMPKAKFATWQDMILNFDPREMFGG